MESLRSCALTLAGALAVGHFAAAFAQDALPKHEYDFKGKLSIKREDSIPYWQDSVRAPAGAPNVVLIMLDDVGFGAAGTFGGPVATPELDQLAATGLRYNQFHTTAICAPTRAALLTGRNHHQAGFGNNYPAAYPGYTTVLPDNTATVAEVLKLNGYSTAAFGKWHNTPVWETSPVGPFEHWPTSVGFEYYYGFMAAETSEWEPRLYRNTTPVEPKGTPEQGYHLTSDLVDDAIHWVHQHDAVASERPFFLYFATGATHAPHHVPKEWIAKYKGQFSQGWDKLREETFARQKKLGVIPAGTELTSRPAGLPAWDSLSPDEKKLSARQMEVYAGYLAHTDHEVGRLLQALKDEGKVDNTLVLYIVGDNGGSAEGSLEGSEANMASFMGEHVDVATMLAHSDDLGGPLYDNHYAAGWSWATTAPFQWMKQIASHFGGTRDGFVVSWPGHTTESAAVRGQFSHVNDIAPTIYEAVGLQLPAVVNGAKQLPLEGKSLVYSFTQPAAPTTHTEQYFEMYGNRGIYKDGWFAGARRYAPWELVSHREKIYDTHFENDRWELYHVSADFSQANDLASQYPEKLQELKDEFDKEARRNNVYPLVPTSQGVPSYVAGKSSFRYRGDVERLGQGLVPNLGATSHRITADLHVPASGSQGVIVAEGGRYGGFSLFVKDGKLTYASNIFGKTRENIVASEPLPAGEVQVAFEYTVDDDSIKPRAGMPAGAGFPGLTCGTGKLFINHKPVGELHFSRFGGFMSSITETFDVGKDTGSPVSNAYQAPYPFTGTVERVTIDLLQTTALALRRP